MAQESDSPIWPKDIETGEYTISMYQPENASYIDNQLKSNLAFSIKKIDKEPQFGMLCTTSVLDADRSSRQAVLVSVKIDEIRLSKDVSEENRLNCNGIY